jgi:hypothetical protein
LGTSISWLNKDIFRYPLTIRFSRKQKTSFAEVYGFGKANGRNRLFPSFLAFSKRMLGISLVVEWTWWLL